MYRTQMVSRFSLLLGIVPVLFAETVPGRYIVELTTEPVAVYLARQSTRQSVFSAAAAVHRATVRAQQAKVRRQLSAAATVLDTADTVANALFVEIAGEQASQIASIEGVRKVYPVRKVRMVLDRAVAINKISETWNLVGAERAGAGIKIAILDSGIDISHPGLQDTSMVVPDSFPKVNSTSDQSYTNNKVIVARSYVSLLATRDPDRSARDRQGHGTALAMIAAGSRATGALATIQGAAPKAYLGNYKIFGTPGYNDYTDDVAILKAMDDAVADGMDIINLSLGTDVSPRLDDDPDVKAIENATKAGVIVVVSAGNAGPDLNTISSPATAPSAISVGASRNDRKFTVSAQVAGLGTLSAMAGSGPAPANAITAALADVSSAGGTGTACKPLAADSLKDKIALILRGDCTFETKLTNAAGAGAVAALLYAAEASPAAVGMDVGSATLPSMMVSYADGISIKRLLASQPGLTATLRFTPSSTALDATRMTDFSSAGPNVDNSIKPDLAAVGSDLYVATQTYDKDGDMYDASGFIMVDGTSFASPLVAGCAAILKGSRPGLTVAQYRSLLINSAVSIKSYTGGAAGVQQTGAGVLDCTAALRATVAVSPTSVGFGAGAASLQAGSPLTITNMGSTADTFTLVVSPSSGDSGPTPSRNTVQLGAGASATVTLAWQAAALSDGAHEGMILVRSAANGTETRVPYWYAVTSATPAAITVLDTITTGRRGSSQRDAIMFRITDAAGVPITAVTPQVTAVSGGGSVQSVVSRDKDYPGVFGVNLRLGSAAGTSTFRIQAGAVSKDVSISVE